jgi:flagellar biosynthesis/type III secretory pathway ATPase
MRSPASTARLRCHDRQCREPGAAVVLLARAHHQRDGWVLSGSNVGKSVLLSTLARNVRRRHWLVGERGRETQEFLQEDPGETGLVRSVIVAAGRLPHVRDRGIFSLR